MKWIKGWQKLSSTSPSWMPCEAYRAGTGLNRPTVDRSLADWVKTGQKHPAPQKNARSQTTYCNLVLEAHFPSISSYSSTHLQGSIFATCWVRPMFVLENILRGRCHRLRSSSIFCERKRASDARALHKWGSCLRRFALSERGSRTIVLQSRGEHAPFPNSSW